MSALNIFRPAGIALALAAALAACGSDEPSGTASAAADAGASSSSAQASGDATAEDVAKEARGKVKCPAKIATAGRAADAPVDDLLGVRPGMSYEEAANAVLCTHEQLVVEPDNSRGFEIQTYGQSVRQGFQARFAQDRVQKSPKEIMAEMQDAAIARGMNRAAGSDVNPGEAKWQVGTMGVPGEEKVISVEREEWFAEGRNPTFASVEEALTKKYGAPSYAFHDGGYNKLLSWAHDARGRPIAENSPLYGCASNANPHAGINLNPDCGVVISASISGMKDNPDVARSLQVRIVDQANGYELVTATEQALEQGEVQRRAEQTRQASENADAPQL